MNWFWSQGSETRTPTNDDIAVALSLSSEQEREKERERKRGEEIDEGSEVLMGGSCGGAPVSKRRGSPHSHFY